AGRPGGYGIGMNTLSPPAEPTAMTAPNALFDTGEPVVNPGVHTPGSPATLFADIVFDRPLDHAYTYAVPDHLAGKVGVGKRVEAPFGKGDRTTPGFCVRVTKDAPSREVKAISRVLDDDALVDDHLMKLTRWMADYYLCGWGQVLHAVVPAGVRENAGTRRAAFVEPVGKDHLPNPLPTVTPQQKAVLDRLKAEGRPLEIGRLARLAKVGPGVVAGLVKKGLLRKFSERVETAAASGDRGPAPDDDLGFDAAAADEITLNADQV